MAKVQSGQRLQHLISIHHAFVVALACLPKAAAIKYNNVNYQIFFIIMHLLLLLTLLTVSSLAHIPNTMQNLCSTQQTRKYIDISGAKIQKITTFEYLLELYDSPATISINGSQVIFRGNFSKLTLRNCALKKEFIYYGTQMILKIPADHVFSMQNIPDLQIQIVHSNAEISRNNPYHFVMFSQLYVVSKFANKIETTLSKYFNVGAKDGDVIETHKIVKIIQGFPMLMYKGTAESFLCRNDLLCLLKREYQLIAQDDFQRVRTLLFPQGETLPKMRAVKRKSLYEIQQIKRRQDGGIEEQL